MFRGFGETWEILIAISTTRGIYWLLALFYLEAENEPCARMHYFILSVLPPMSVKHVRVGSDTRGPSVHPSGETTFSPLCISAYV